MAAFENLPGVNPGFGTDKDGSASLAPHNTHARDQVLFGQILLDALLPFLTPRDLGRLARTCRDGRQVVYEDGRSIVVALDLNLTFKPSFDYKNKDKVPKPIFTSAATSYLNFSGLRFVNVFAKRRNGRKMAIDDNIMSQIQQLLGPKLETFSFEVVPYDGDNEIRIGQFRSQEIAHLQSLGRSLALSPLSNLKHLVLLAEIASVTVQLSNTNKNRCKIESLVIIGDIGKFTEESLALQLAAGQSIRRLDLRVFDWPDAPDGRDLSSPAGKFLERVLPGLSSLYLDTSVTSLATLIPIVTEHLTGLQTLSLSVADYFDAEEGAPLDVQKLATLPALRVFEFARLDATAVGVGPWISFLGALAVREFGLRSGGVKLSDMQYGVLLGLLESDGGQVLRHLTGECRKRLVSRLRNRQEGRQDALA